MANRKNNTATEDSCNDCCSGANSLLNREVAGLRLTEATHPPGRRVKPHAHERVHFCFLLQGIYEEHWGTQVVTRRPRSLALTANGAVHSNQIHRAGIRFFTIELTEDWNKHANGSWGPHRSFTQFESGSLPWLAARLYREFRISDASSLLSIEGLTLELLAGAARHNVLFAEDQNVSWLQQVKELLHDRFREPITLAEVAQVARVHPVSLARAFRRTYGCTMGDYLRRLRIEFASRRLATSNESLLEVALESGFFDQSHFCRTFKSLTGLTPSQYRSNGR